MSASSVAATTAAAPDAASCSLRVFNSDASFPKLHELQGATDVNTTLGKMTFLLNLCGSVSSQPCFPSECGDSTAHPFVGAPCLPYNLSTASTGTVIVQLEDTLPPPAGTAFPNGTCPAEYAFPCVQEECADPATNTLHNCTAKCIVAAESLTGAFVEWIDAAATDKGVTIKFPDAPVPLDPRSPFSCSAFSTVLVLACDPRSDAPPLTLENGAVLDSGCDVFLNGRSPVVCEPLFPSASKKKHLRGGAIFGILLLVAVAVYLIGGVAYMRLTSGSYGYPNAAFWRSLIGRKSTYTAL